MARYGYLTPDNVPIGRHCRVFSIPDDTWWLGTFMGALLPLTYPTSWQEYGELTADEAAQVMLDVIWEAYQDDAQVCPDEMVETPFYDSDESVDDEEPLGEQTWLDAASDFVIEGFLMVTLTPAAAIAYSATIPKIRLAFKTGDAGVIVRTIFNGIETLHDTFSPTPSLMTIELDAGVGFARMLDAEYDLRIEHTGTANPLATPIGGQYVMQVVRGDLRPVANPCTTCIYRYTPEGEYEYSPDNGSSWIPVPEQDPRVSDAFRQPARTDEDAQCNSAASIVRWLTDFNGEVLSVVAAGATVTGVSGTIMGLIGGLGLYGTIASLAVAGAALIIDIGVQVVSDALTTEVWDTLLCLIYNNSDENGQISVAQFNTIQSEIGSEIGGTAGLVLNAELLLPGAVGMSNAGAAGLDTDDCSACDDQWCWEWDFTESSHTGDGWFADTYGSYVSGQGWSTVPVSGAYTMLLRQNTIPLSTTSIDADWTYNGLGTGTVGVNILGFYKNTGGYVQVGGNTELSGLTAGLTVSEILANIILNPNGGGTAGVAIITKIVFRGTGPNPYGVDNCV